MPTTLKETVEIGNKAYKLPLGIQYPIIELIDFKTNNDMKELITEMRTLHRETNGELAKLRTDMDGKFTAMDGKFFLIDTLVSYCK